jgi:Fe(3+) dicitrate transport protein
MTRTNTAGAYTFPKIPYDNYTIVVQAEGKKTLEKFVKANQPELIFNLILQESVVTLQEVSINAERENNLGLDRLRSVENFGIYEGKKTEVIVLGDLTANTATNNARQLYSKVTGLNIWESDQAGLQLGIGGRGLSPNRTANFNTRQNGYDISADALGYPESYYTPPAEALEQIEIVRGAASLQYGTQFGGLLNFKFNRGPADKKLEFTSRQSIGSWGFFGSFNSFGGTVAKGKLNYYTYYQFKRGDGYRPNSGFDYHNVYASVNWKPVEKLLVNIDITKMTYQAQQAGGLTDKLFSENPLQSLRARNWFAVDWNLAAINLTYSFNTRTQLNMRNFGLLAQRQSLGNLERINVADFGNNRTLINGDFKNVGSEVRLLHRYTIGNKQQALLIGTRVYHGTTTAQQGDGTNDSGPDFYYINPGNLENSDYTFPNRNYAVFAENIFDVTDKFSVTPGLRIENIQTFADGYYKQRVLDAAGNVVVENTIIENNSRNRSFLIGGVGVSYKVSQQTEFYANFSQNYRAINFTDLRVVNPNFIVDPDIQDEEGFTTDAGVRGKLKGIFNYEVTGFYIRYKGKIGQILRADQPPLFIDYRFRGNISDARNLGIEAFGELLLSSLLKWKPETSWSVVANTSVIDARYINSDDTSIQNKKVEMVPHFLIRTGTTLRHKNFSATLQHAYTARHFSDATNAVRTSTAVEGEIPAYQIVDISLSYKLKRITFEGSINNVLNQQYFTRRAEAYPGPGIIPADGRGFYITVQYRIGVR